MSLHASLRRRCAPTLLAVLLSASFALAQSRPPALGAETPNHVDAFLVDLNHTVACRQRLLEDPILGRLNLGVRVKDRVAILWGPAPSAEVRRRAEECLRTLIELSDVRNELHVAPDFDWGPPAPANPPAVLPEQLPPALPNPPWPRPRLRLLDPLPRGEELACLRGIARFALCDPREWR